ncbi:MAG: hypothetical protein S4CHLAM45_07220 [Chlamydiales bacterium]|nr:hypothetical protein [Chlamydiales bacterium]MCH9620261.1 hypothetical protein [Chlamydiales bacterium]MCH9622829.1 hypothetical protein [Chlamydiales bacterium]
MSCFEISIGGNNPPTNYEKIAGYGAVITGIALLALSACLAAGIFTPGIEAHIAYYSGAGLAGLSLIPFAVSVVLLCRDPKRPPLNEEL